MNKKILKLGVLLVFIFSCNVNTSNSNVDIKPTISVSSNISASPTVTTSVEITTSTIPSPTITPIPTPIATPYTQINSFDENFKLNKEIDGIENGYDGKVLIIIDTYLLKDYIKSEEELKRMKRKVMILKDSYNELSDYDKEQLKKEYGEYYIFDRDTYTPLTEGKRKSSIYEGELSIGSIGVKFIHFDASRAIPAYRGMYFYTENRNDYSIYSLELQDPFSYNIKYLHKNIKLSNKRKIMKAPIQKIVFSSIYGLSEFSEMIYYTVNYTDTMGYTGIDNYSIYMYENYNTWTNCLPEYCKKDNL